jgi:ribosome-binding factor A
MPRTSSKLSPTHRIERVGELIRQALAEILARGDILDPDLDRWPVTISGVRMSPDLKQAAASVMPLGGQNAEATIAALNRHKKELRARVAQRIDLKFAPDLRFALDSTFDAQARIDALLKRPEVARDLGGDGGENKDET